jgi:hypothetical protein
LPTQFAKLTFQAPDLSVPGAEKLDPDLSSARENQMADGGMKYYELKNASVVFPPILEEQLQAIGRDVYEQTGQKIIITSAVRSPEEQARAMFNNRKNDENPRPITQIYRNQSAARELENIYTDGLDKKLSDREIIGNMSEKIEEQVAQGVFISRHLDSNAVDISFRGLEGLSKSEVDGIVQAHGGSLLKEDDHYHVKIIPLEAQPAVDDSDNLVEHANKSDEPQLPTAGAIT